MPVATSRPWDLPDGLWELIEPLLPRTPRRFRYPGRKRIGDRGALSGILFVLYTGIAGRHLPLELGFGSGATCRRRLDEGQAAGGPGRALQVPSGRRRGVRGAGGARR